MTGTNRSWLGETLPSQWYEHLHFYTCWPCENCLWTWILNSCFILFVSKAPLRQCPTHNAKVLLSSRQLRVSVVCFSDRSLFLTAQLILLLWYLVWRIFRRTSTNHPSGVRTCFAIVVTCFLKNIIISKKISPTALEVRYLACDIVSWTATKIV